MRSTAVISAVLLGMVLVGSSRADDLTDVGAIVDNANLAAYYAGDDGRAEVRMTITDAQGRERRRQFVILRKDNTDGGE